jgi:hypothetical protein
MGVDDKDRKGQAEEVEVVLAAVPGGHAFLRRFGV